MAEEPETKWASDGAAVEDSNMAGVGSAADKAARTSAAETEEAWVGAGESPGLQIWRIEQFQVVAWPEEEYGNFFKGDSYIVLKTTADRDSGKLLYDIHFWLGSETSQDEQGTAAYKTVELDDLKGGAATQHREVEAHESTDFMALFKQITYIEGGVESGFRHVTPDAYIAKLFMVRKEMQCVKVVQVPMTTASLNQGDCFFLDAGGKIYSWFGDSASPFEKNKCNNVVRNLASSRSGQATAMSWESDADDFWALLGGEAPIASAEEGNCVDRRQSLQEVGEGVLYKLSEGTGELIFSEVGRGNVHKGMLSSDDVYVLDDGSEVFIWVGSNSSSIEKEKALATASSYLTSHDKPAHTPIHLFKESVPIRNRRWKAIMSS